MVKKLVKEEFQRISHSKAKLWRRCHRAYHYRYVERIERKRQPLPLFRGSIIHAMLEARATRALTRKGSTPLEVLGEYAKKYSKLLEEEKEYYGDVIIECEKIYQGYEREYKDDRMKILGYEEEIIVKLSDKVEFICYLDMRVKDKSGMKWLMEHKSHKNIPDEDVRFSDLQTVFYVWAWNKLHEDNPVDGIIWDYLRTKPPTIPEQLKNGQLTIRANIDTDYSTYLSEVKRLKLKPKDYEETLTRLKNTRSSFFERVRLPSPPRAMISEAVSDLTSTAEQIALLGTKVKDRNMTRECASTCEFFNVCQAEMRGLDANYVRKAEYRPRQEMERGEEKANQEGLKAKDDSRSDQVDRSVRNR